MAKQTNKTIKINKTEHVQASIPTLPSGGSLPLGIFAWIPGVGQLGVSGLSRLDGHQASHCKYFKVLFLCVYLNFITIPGSQSLPVHLPTGLLATWG